MLLVHNPRIPVTDFGNGHLSGILSPVLSNSALTPQDKLRLIGLVLLLWQRLKLTSTSKVTSSSATSLVGMLKMYAESEDREEKAEERNESEEGSDGKKEENCLIRALLDMADMR